MIAFFPGQGSQHVGMGKALHDNFSSAREVFEEASDAVKLNLKKLCFEGPEGDLTLTENTQPSLVTVSVAAFRVARVEAGFQPSVVAGHSLGEYSALVAAGALSLSSAVRWVRERGQAMQQAVPPGEGTMAAIMGLEDDDVRRLCELATVEANRRRESGQAGGKVPAVAEPANFNSPGQVVIAGSLDAIGVALELAKTDEFKGAKAIPLSVSAPFHCRLMAPARDRMASIFANAADAEKPARLSCPYVPNRTARLTSEPGVIFEMLVEQIDHPVLWKQSIESLLAANHASGVEFGPGKVLAGLAKRISKKAGKELRVLPMGTPDDLDGLKG